MLQFGNGLDVSKPVIFNQKGLCVPTVRYVARKNDGMLNMGTL